MARYRRSRGEPRYLAAYEVDRTDLPMSKLSNDTSDIGRWKPEMWPDTYNKYYIVGERIWPRSYAARVSRDQGRARHHGVR